MKLILSIRSAYIQHILEPGGNQVAERELVRD